MVLRRERTRRVVLAGCTPVGLQLAARLERERCSLRIVTRHRARAMLLPASLADGALVGDLLEPAVMTAAGLASADVLLAATAHDDGNAALALAGARLFAIPLVAALVADPGRASAYAALGLATVCSDARTADEFVRRARALHRAHGPYEPTVIASPFEVAICTMPSTRSSCAAAACR